MMIDTKTIVSMTEANQNFSRVARMTEQYGSITIFKNNRPKYKIIDLEQDDSLDLTDDEKIDIVARRVLNEYRPAFEALAK